MAKETRIQRKKTVAYNNGKWIHVGNFNYDILTGEVSGNVHCVPVKANVNPATEYKRGMAQEAKRATDEVMPNFSLSANIYLAPACVFRIATFLISASLTSGVVKPSFTLTPFVPKKPFEK